MQKNTCCFLGHRTIEISDTLKIYLYNIIEKLIVENNVDTFYFGNNSQFNDLCYDIICQLKTTYSYIKRVYVRSHFPEINDTYKDYLLERYEESYYFSEKHNIGKVAYIKRNYEMINKSDFCVFYLNNQYFLTKSKSGTKLAYEYARKNKKTVINIFDALNMPLYHL